MKGIYCSCIGKETLEEAPFAYRGLEAIAERIFDTVEVKLRGLQCMELLVSFRIGERLKDGKV